MKESVRIIRFAVVGTLNALITSLIVALMMHVFNVYYIGANVAAYLVAQVHNFIWSRYWVFPRSANRWKNSLSQQMVWFLMAFLLAYGTQFLFLLALVELLKCNEYWAQFFGLFVYGGINFLVNRFHTFRCEKSG